MYFVRISLVKNCQPFTFLGPESLIEKTIKLTAKATVMIIVTSLWHLAPSHGAIDGFSRKISGVSAVIVNKKRDK